MIAGYQHPDMLCRCRNCAKVSDDLKKIDIPTLILHGDDDQIVPIANSSLLTVKLMKNAQLKVYEGAPHGLCTTLKDQVNSDLLEFIRG